MPHLVESLHDVPLLAATQELQKTHDYLVSRAVAALPGFPMDVQQWGRLSKQYEVSLPDAPKQIGKKTERFIEIVTITATIERLLAALNWFGKESKYSTLHVKVCHPATSSGRGNDLVLADENGFCHVYCEVFDVLSGPAGKKKEKQSIKHLKCNRGVPQDGAFRFLCLPNHLADSLMSLKRKWTTLPYRYQRHNLGDDAKTVLLEIQPTGDLTKA